MAPNPSVIHALSTMWSQGNFSRDGHEGDDMAAFAERTATLGFPHVEINYVIPPAGVEAILNSNHVSFSSIHNPCPRVKVNGKNSEHLNLAARDEEERGAAVQVARESIETAQRAGAKLMVVHLGGVGGNMFDEEKQLRRLYDAGTRDGEQVEALRKSAVERRRREAPDWFPQAKRSLAEIAEVAAPAGVAIGLESRFHYHEFPDIDDMHELLADYPNEVAGFWIDIGHVEVLDRLGLIPRHRWLNELGDRCIGSHVHDVDGLADHRAPGRGTADWDHYRDKLPPHIPRIFEINQRQSAEDVANSIPFLRERGVLPRA
jgi:sugar phosphate isomerase/epimerase